MSSDRFLWETQGYNAQIGIEQLPKSIASSLTANQVLSSRLLITDFI